MFDISIMTTEMWLGVIAFLVGLVLVFGAVFRKQAGWKFNPVWSGVFGVVLIVFGGAVGVLPMLPEAQVAPTINVDLPSAAVDQPTFHVDVANGTSGKINTSLTNIADDEKSAQIILQHMNLAGDELDNCRYASINFTVSPIPPEGATADSLATIYFETDYLMKYEGEEVLVESSGTVYANWSYAGGSSDEQTGDYSGAMTMLMTETGYAQIDYQFDSGNADVFSTELDTVGESGSWSVTLHNADWSWSEVFTVNWIYIGAS